MLFLAASRSRMEAGMSGRDPRADWMSKLIMKGGFGAPDEAASALRRRTRGAGKEIVKEQHMLHDKSRFFAFNGALLVGALQLSLRGPLILLRSDL